MSKSQGKGEGRRQGSGQVDFREHYASSSLFDKTFREGMALVEETATYLDGQGRKDSQELDRPASLAYATESMRLTTRLMQMASWLLLQRAVKDGEMSSQEAVKEKYRVNLDDVARNGDDGGNPHLPPMLRDLISRSSQLHDRILRLDEMLRAAGAASDPRAQAIDAQLDRLKAAFSATSKDG